MTQTAAKPRHQVGQTDVYPSWTEWQVVATVPRTLAWLWLEEVAPQATVCGRTDVTVEQYVNREAPGCDWLNKLYVIIEVDLHRIVALYNYDGKICLIQKRNR